MNQVPSQDARDHSTHSPAPGAQELPRNADPEHAASCTHGHGHHHVPGNMNRAFALGVTLNVGFVVVELISGSLANSLALLADAGHNLSDVLGLVLAWVAHRLNHARPSPRRTYGWKSTSILAALFNAQMLLMAVGAIVWEAMQRFFDNSDASGGVIIVVAITGVLINTFTALLFLRDGHHDLNVRGAFLHMAADAAVSLGVVVAGLIIAITGLQWVDPVTSVIIAGVILWSTWGLLRESLDLAMHAVPRHVDIQAVTAVLARLPGVTEVHDLHVWAMSTTETALTAHLVKPDIGDDDELLALATRQLNSDFGIEHITLQIERIAAARACRQASDDVV